MSPATWTRVKYVLSQDSGLQYIRYSNLAQTFYVFRHVHKYLYALYCHEVCPLFLHKECLCAGPVPQCRPQHAVTCTVSVLKPLLQCNLHIVPIFTVPFLQPSPVMFCIPDAVLICTDMYSIPVLQCCPRTVLKYTVPVLQPCAVTQTPRCSNMHSTCTPALYVMQCRPRNGHVLQPCTAILSTY